MSSDPVSTLREFVRAKRTGTLTIRDGSRVASVRLAAGSIEDAVYLEATGEKALYRALGLAGATWSFENSTGGVRRIRTPTEQLLHMAQRVLAEIERLRRAFPDAHERPLFAVETEPGLPLSISTSGRALLVHLRAPILLDQLLDRVPATDLEILAAVLELKLTGRARFLASPKDRVPLATPDVLKNLARFVEFRKKTQIGRAARIVLAGSPPRLAVIAHGVSCLEGASPPTCGTPLVPVPQVPVRLPLYGDAVLEIALCPLVPAYAPLWPMAIQGAFAVVRIDEAAEHLVDQACEAAGLLPLEARDLVPNYDPTKVADIARLLVQALHG